MGSVHFPYQLTIKQQFKDVQGGIPKSDLLGVTVALIHVAGQQFLAECYKEWSNNSNTIRIWVDGWVRADALVRIG